MCLACSLSYTYHTFHRCTSMFGYSLQETLLRSHPNHDNNSTMESIVDKLKDAEPSGSKNHQCSSSRQNKEQINNNKTTKSVHPSSDDKPPPFLNDPSRSLFPKLACTPLAAFMDVRQRPNGRHPLQQQLNFPSTH